MGAPLEGTRLGWPGQVSDGSPGAWSVRSCRPGNDHPPHDGWPTHQHLHQYQYHHAPWWRRKDEDEGVAA